MKLMLSKILTANAKVFAMKSAAVLTSMAIMFSTVAPSAYATSQATGDAGMAPPTSTSAPATATPEATVAPTVAPEATVEPTATPEATVEPTVAPTATPEATVEPTIAPTQSPEAGDSSALAKGASNFSLLPKSGFNVDFVVAGTSVSNVVVDSLDSTNTHIPTAASINTNPACPDGYAFAGWSTVEGDASSRITFPYTPTDSTTLYAIYEDVVVAEILNKTYASDYTSVRYTLKTTINPNIVGFEYITAMNGDVIKPVGTEVEPGVFERSFLVEDKNGRNHVYMYNIPGKKYQQEAAKVDTSEVKLPTVEFSYLDFNGDVAGSFEVEKNSNGWLSQLPTMASELNAPEGYHLKYFTTTMFGVPQQVTNITSAKYDNEILTPVFEYDVTFEYAGKTQTVRTYYHILKDNNLLSTNSIEDKNNQSLLPAPKDKTKVYTWVDELGVSYTEEEIAVMIYTSPKTFTATEVSIEASTETIIALEKYKTYDTTPLNITAGDLLNHVRTQLRDNTITLSQIKVNGVSLTDETAVIVAKTDAHNATKPNEQIETMTQLGYNSVAYTVMNSAGLEIGNGVAKVAILPQSIIVNRVSGHRYLKGDDTLIKSETSATNGFDISYVSSIPNGGSGNGTSSALIALTGMKAPIDHTGLGGSIKDSDLSTLTVIDGVLGNVSVELVLKDGVKPYTFGENQYSSAIFDFNINNGERSNYYIIVQPNTEIGVVDYSADDIVKNYDGKGVEISNDGSIKDVAPISSYYGYAVEVKFYNEETGKFDLDKLTTPEDVGTYEYKYKYTTKYTSQEALSDTTQYSTITVKINPIEVEYTVNNASKQQGAQDPEFTAKLTDGVLIENDEIKLDINRTNSSVEAVGTYEDVLKASVLSGNDEGNYIITLIEGDFEITSAPPAPIQPDVEPTPPVTPVLPIIPDGEDEGTDTPETEVEEQDVPFAPAPEVEIEDTDVPFAGATPAWALVNLILTIITAITSAMLLISYFKNKDDEEWENDEAKRKRKGGYRILSVIVMIVSIITFILTEDMTQPMILIDKWTLLMAVYAVIQLVVARLSRKEVEVDEEIEANA